MLKTISIAVLPLLVLLGGGSLFLFSGPVEPARSEDTGTLEKMIVASGSVAMDVDNTKLGVGKADVKSSISSLRFEAEKNSFFTVMAYNDEFRGALPGSMNLVAPVEAPALPGRLAESFGNLMVEHTAFGGEPYEIVISDAKTGFRFFNVEGHEYEFDGNRDTLAVRGGRILLSKEFAAELGRPNDAGMIVGELNITASLRAIEVTHVVNGEVEKQTLPPMDPAGGVPGPDVIVGDVVGLAQFGSASGDYVGLAIGTDSCNAGVVDLNWFALPNNDHPVIPQNLNRMSGGAQNDERFEQIGQSSVKHAFTALTQNLCGFGCNGVGGSRLGSGCSDPYSASLNAGPSLGSRAWINPFTGFFPRGDSVTPPNNHAGHVHTGPSHRVLTKITDLATNLNPGATYWAEAQYVTPHEYTWCQANPGQCNMYNNVSYRRYNVTGTASPFSFSAAGSTIRTKPAIMAWPNATVNEIRPAPGADGIGFVAYKVTNPSPGVWQYEYAIFNQNLDRAVGAFSVPVGAGAQVTNVGFHAPPQHPGWSADGTDGSAGYSSTPWTVTQNAGSVSWATETIAQNPNANAIRWGTMYNFRFTSNQPPQNVNATVGFFKTGEPITVQVQAPSGGVAASVYVEGRVMSADGFGVANARVSITDGGGNTVTVLTSPFGYYRISGVTAGATYTMGVASKRHSFTSREVIVNGNLSGVDFTANP
ncbi:MAG: carboxypeptidase-like regulatory domain-containing protein [Pyrinomonadaceae bacterium]|nr:carboxypeptidase-like regulatory domain-containing protein [Pyrinomonadaceae bacterium]